MQPDHSTFQEFHADLRAAVKMALSRREIVTGIEISPGTEAALSKVTYAELGDVATKILVEGPRSLPTMYGYPITWDAPETRLLATHIDDFKPSTAST